MGRVTGMDVTERTCTECRHSAITDPTHSAAIRRLFGLRPKPAECPLLDEDYSGLGPLPCGCNNPAHGS